MPVIVLLELGRRRHDDHHNAGTRGPLRSPSAHVGDLIGYPARPTPYDTGTRLESKPWVKERITGEDHPRLAEVDDYGRVDFDDTGFTVATVHIEAEPASAGEVYVMKLSANAPIIIHGPGGE